MHFITTAATIALIISGCHAQESCSPQRGRTVQYQRGSTFISLKEDGSQYNCRCIKRGCLKIYCSRSNGPTPRPRPTEGDAIIGEALTNAPPIVIQPPASIPTAPPPAIQTPRPPIIGRTCYDSVTNKGYRPREYFRRYSTAGLLQFCKCSEASGISCWENAAKSCRMPERNRRLNGYNPYRRRIATNSFYVSGHTPCFDQWNNRTYPSGSTYHRVRDMNDRGDIKGTYRCSCTNGYMHCTAIDIPCCDHAKGEWADKGQAVVINRTNSLWDCTCMGQRGRYQNCFSIPKTRPPAPGVGCVDVAQITHAPGTEWYRYNRRGERYRCRCEANGLGGYATDCIIDRS